MTKADIVTEIVKKTDIDKKIAEDVVNALMNTVKTSMVKGENIYLRGFGTFLIQHRAAKPGRNILNKSTVLIPAHTLPKFKPCKEFLNMVSENVEVKAN